MGGLGWEKEEVGGGRGDRERWRDGERWEEGMREEGETATDSEQKERGNREREKENGKNTDPQAKF